LIAFSLISLIAKGLQASASSPSGADVTGKRRKSRTYLGIFYILAQEWPSWPFLKNVLRQGLPPKKTRTGKNACATLEPSADDLGGTAIPGCAPLTATQLR
jgi:hypothetical protein